MKREGDRPEAQDRLAALEEQIAGLQERVTVLEATLASTPPHRAVSPATLDVDAAAFEQRYGAPRYAQGSLRGAITYSGFAQFDQKRFLEHRERALPSLFTIDPAVLAPIFAALASPHRLTVLRALCAGPRSRQELQEVLGVASSGHLYHHLKELLSTGLVVQQGRSTYAVPRPQVIPICVALMVAADVLIGSPPGPQTDDQGNEEDANAER